MYNELYEGLHVLLHCLMRGGQTDLRSRDSGGVKEGKREKGEGKKEGGREGGREGGTEGREEGREGRRDK